MKISREIISKAGLYPKLRLGIKNGRGVTPTGPHKVKIIEEKLVKKFNSEAVEEHFMRYIFEEAGERKQYDCHVKSKVGSDPHYFVQAMAEIEPGEELVLEMKKAGVKSYIEVTRVSTNSTEKVDVDDDDEPDRSAGEVGPGEEPTIDL